MAISKSLGNKVIVYYLTQSVIFYCISSLHSGVVTSVSFVILCFRHAEETVIFSTTVKSKYKSKFYNQNKINKVFPKIIFTLVSKVDEDKVLLKSLRQKDNRLDKSEVSSMALPKNNLPNRSEANINISQIYSNMLVEANIKHNWVDVKSMSVEELSDFGQGGGLNTLSLGTLSQNKMNKTYLSSITCNLRRGSNGASVYNDSDQGGHSGGGNVEDGEEVISTDNSTSIVLNVDVGDIDDIENYRTFGHLGKIVSNSSGSHLCYRCCIKRGGNRIYVRSNRVICISSAVQMVVCFAVDVKQGLTMLSLVLNFWLSLWLFLRSRIVYIVSITTSCKFGCVPTESNKSLTQCVLMKILWKVGSEKARLMCIIQMIGVCTSMAQYKMLVIVSRYMYITEIKVKVTSRKTTVAKSQTLGPLPIGILPKLRTASKKNDQLTFLYFSFTCSDTTSSATPDTSTNTESGPTTRRSSSCRGKLPTPKSTTRKCKLDQHSERNEKINRRPITPSKFNMNSLLNKSVIKFHDLLYFPDKNDANKGSVLYAPPALPAEHFVFLSKIENKGGTISSIRFYLKSLISEFKNILQHWPKLLSLRHPRMIKKLRLIYDIEPNPGPQLNMHNRRVIVISLNCRGLGSMDKTRLLLNKLYAMPTSQTLIVMLQETMITNPRYLELAWRGKFVQTNGTGNSQGFITLLHSDSEISEVKHYDSRAHLFTLTTSAGDTMKVCNVYAPNGFDANKNDFFHKVFQDLDSWDGSVVIGGDFNVTLAANERHNRGVTAAELRTADIVKDYTRNLNLYDGWEGRTGYTWRRGKSMSRLDRIYYRMPHYIVKSFKTNWTLTTSDHAGLILVLENQQRTFCRNEHIKLDNGVVQNKLTLCELADYVTEQLQTTNGMNPHVKLEFAKMTVRTKALEIMSRNKRKENEQLKELDAAIKENMRLLTVYTDTQSHIVLTNELESLNIEKNNILNKQGEALAHRAKTKWYNEGERSNKYFLNLLKRHSESSEMKALVVDDTEVSDPEEVREAVTQFYQELYNKDEGALRCDEHFLDTMFEVDDGTNEGVGAPVTLNELWSTLKPTKATTPGPDGLSNVYLKKLWDILGPLILEAWNFSLQTGVLPPSHRTSLLRLIPKAGKDRKHLKNWRPITLSNCDHKLITRLYNNRLLTAISDEISVTQTAYIKGRSISDNLRLLNAVTKLTDFEENINATIIALDAQKAFDSVSHKYITQVLSRVGLTRLVPIFQLLYKDLENDIIINGRIGKGYKICNGVKQGDALSCSLFILAIEPLIRNITNNVSIRAVQSERLNFVWPKLVAYADDITVLTCNERDAVNAIFTEYSRLTNASGLMLNADKTEKFDLHSRNVVGPERQVTVCYGGQNHELESQDSIKLNGIIFMKQTAAMRQANYEITLNKMINHFKEWGRRSLSLLGKIQIIKTFGISQYLYALAVIDLEVEHGKAINKEIHKFLWNKGYSQQTNAAPHRIKSEIMYTEVAKGGFGMIKLEQVIASSSSEETCIPFN